MCVNAGGIFQTLYNVFSFIDAEDILCVAPHEQFVDNPPSPPFSLSYVTYKFEVIKCPKNRLAKYIGSAIDWLNYSFNAKLRSFRDIKRKIEGFNPDIVISCSNGTKGAFMHYKLISAARTKTIFPYFMDDWMYQSKLKWFGGDIHTVVKEILNTRSWLMISEELATILQARYNIIPQSLLIVHNPVDLSDAPKITPLKKKSEYKLAYAGALWPMHFDSFCLIAACLHQLKEKISVKLIWYTSLDFWKWRKTELEPFGVLYGGNIPYNEIHNTLSQADALLVCSSFSKDWYTHSRASVQTKITDYLKARRLIISCGPDYSANHNFLKKHQCGICIETINPIDVMSQMQNILNHIEDYQYMINNGWQLLEKEYTLEKVHKKVKLFLSYKL